MRIVKNGNGAPRSAAAPSLAFNIDIESMKKEAEAIELIANTYGLTKEIEHLKQAAFYCTIGSGLVPDCFQGDYRSIFLMSQRAKAMNVPLSDVLQGGYFVHGRWGWYAEFMVNRALGAGFYTMIDYETSGKLEDNSLRVRAFGVRPNGEKIYGSIVGIEMAKKEGWTKNPKYDSMPLYMLTKRAATFMIRNTCPHLFGGSTRTADELEDIAAVANRGTVVDAAPSDQATTPEAITVAALKQKDDKDRLEILATVSGQIEAIKKSRGWDTERLNDELGSLLLDIKLEDVDKLPQNALLSLHKFLNTEFK